MAIKLGHSQSLVVPEDEIIERLLAIWSEAVSKGARPSPELYRQCVSDVLRSYVREKRESATAFMRRFSDTYTYDDMLPLFAADDEASNIVPREKEPVPEPKNFTEPAPPTTNAEEVPEVRQKIVTPQTLKIIHMRQRLRRRRTIGILLFILVAALFAWSGRILDAVPKVVSLDDIPDILQVYQSNSEHWPAGNQQLGRTLWGQPTAKVRVIESLYQSALSQQTWIIALKSAECMPFLRRLDDSKAAAWALRRAARELEYQLTGPVQSQKMSSVYAHYPVDILVARAPAYPTGNSEESGWLETGISALPEGIGAVGVVRTQYLTNSLAENSLMKNPKQVLRLIQGRAFFCRQPTLWGWYIDRDRYLP